MLLAQKTHGVQASTIGTTTTSPSVASDRLEAIHEALETPSQSREWSHAKIKSQSDPPKTECSNSDKFAAIAPPAGGATPSSQIINHGGTINIYYNTCQGHPSNGTNQNASVECAPDENTTFDRAFVQPPSAPISEVVRYSDQTMLDSSIFSTVPDTDVSIAEKRFIQDGVVLILDGASDRAVIFKAISKLVEKTITEKWDLELRAYVPLEPAIAEDIRRRLEEDSDVNIDRNGLVSPPSASAWDTVRPGQWIEQRRRCNRSNKNDDTRVNFSDLNSSGFEPEEMDNGTPSRGLRVPPHNPPQPRHSPWTKAKDNLAQNEGMMPDDSSLVLYNSTDADLDRLILSPSSNADEHAPAPRKDPEILAKVLKGPKEATSKLINLRGRTANPPPGENSTTGPAVGTGAKDRSSTQPNRHMTRASSKLEEAGESRATSILPPAVVEGGRKVKRKKKKKKPAKAGADVVEKCTSENTDGSGSRDDRRRTARTAALDSIARLALEAGPEASQQASEGNFSFLLGPTSENRRCRLCRQMFTDQTNVRQEDGSAPCSYHPGN
ncbi:unnamed protein product [Discula destructiva]